MFVLPVSTNLASHIFCRLQYNGSNTSTARPLIDGYDPAGRSEGNGYPSLAAPSTERYPDSRHRGSYGSNQAASPRSMPTLLRDKGDISSTGRALSHSPNETPAPFQEQAASERTSFGRLSDTERSRHPPSPFVFGSVAKDNPHVSGVSSPSRKRPHLDLATSSNKASGASVIGPRRSHRAGSTHWRMGKSESRLSSSGPEANGEQLKGKRFTKLRSFEHQGSFTLLLVYKTIEVLEQCPLILCASMISGRQQPSVLPPIAGMDIKTVPTDGGTSEIAAMSARTGASGGRALKRTYQACIRYVRDPGVMTASYIVQLTDSYFPLHLFGSLLRCRKKKLKVRTFLYVSQAKAGLNLIMHCGRG